MADNIGPFCAVLGPDGKIVLDYIAPIIYLTGAAFIIPLIVMFIRSRITRNLNIPNPIFYTTLIYFIIQFITFICYTMWVRYECYNGQISLNRRISPLLIR